MTVLGTPRLVLRPLEAADDGEFAALNGDAEVMRHFSAPLTRIESDTMRARLQARWREEGFAFAGAFLPEGGLAGMVGLMRVRPDMPFAPAVEIGWRIAVAHQRRGFAEEAARAWIAHGFGALGLGEIVAFTVPANEPSWRLMEKLGMRRAGEFEHPALPEGHALRRHLLYRLARPG
ncbi:GNAT family N-acetyltransferase [Sabulicella glaciei]|uniref:GNAT family N-acetyltransferase n=1 Tax=Sabulicella glaciei TaxID=2984948 RepID=A0ABT3NWL6_9PROT|nr:GNAT family N-acetyltransferase [Roseococcus sp. MDT2-1-1]MCW8086553.1 GNAT family N-acetyltransferase [Roseococcus sp. MDT2-1-1]